MACGTVLQGGGDREHRGRTNGSSVGLPAAHPLPNPANGRRPGERQEPKASQQLAVEQLAAEYLAAECAAPKAGWSSGDRGGFTGLRAGRFGAAALALGSEHGDDDAKDCQAGECPGQR